MKARGEKRATVLVEHILGQLKSGMLKNGDKLPSEHALMQVTGISRGSVREGLSALEMVGIVRRQQGGGTYIKGTAPTLFGVNSEEMFVEFLKDAENSNHLFSAYEARVLFEPKVAALAASRAKEENIAECAAIMQRMEAAVESRKREQLIQADIDFHIAIAKSTQNEIVAKTMKRIIEMASASMFRAYKRSNPREIYEEHRRIFEAVKAGDAEAARICCEYNLLKTYKPL